MDWLEIAKWAGSIIAAIVTGGIVFKRVISHKSSKNSSIRYISQKYNQAGGDIIGGDSIKKTGK